MQRRMSGSDESSFDMEEPFQDSGSEFVPSDNCSEASNLSEKALPASQLLVSEQKERQWKRNIGKRKRAAGEEYVNTRERVIPSKSIEAKDCPCSKKCHENFSQKWREDLFKNFYRLGSHT
ncbi:unnamed protein product [Psylliodes chrysocephalus]|uniref:Uncharacterized protein n=1 Tax=Psylliodes chrysocephalus TaxID=3402493 RepID=A0A9P0CK04_9CUCU|nr:unnamed protein product [Psylliodes chrysocephala]